GGAHRDPAVMAQTLKATLMAELAKLDPLSKDELLDRRYARLRRYGAFAAG
ncbi:MAG: acetyl-CoA carboxylase carboxyl transferase subunit alpha, partial [Silanimonas sp.]